MKLITMGLYLIWVRVMTNDNYFRLGADRNAIKSTQILRVPYTYNIKDYPKKVKIIVCDDRNNNSSV